MLPFLILLQAVLSKNFANLPGILDQLPSGQSMKMAFTGKALGDSTVGANLLAYTMIGQFSIGTPGQKFQLLVDTGSSLFWVRSSNCKTSECQGKAAFDNTKSSTYQKSNITRRPTTLSYLDNTQIICSINADTLTIGQKSIAFQNICEAYSIVTPTASVDGIIGVGPPQLKTDLTPSDTKADVFVSLLTQNQVNQKTISFWFNRQQKLAGNGDAGEITFGDIDTTRFMPPILYSPIIEDRSHWIISMEQFVVANETNLLTQPALSVIDTGTTVFLLPASIFKAFAAQIDGLLTDGSSYYVDCLKSRNLKPLSIQFAGMSPLTLNWDQQIIADLNSKTCMLIFQPTSGNTALIGAQFLRNFYTVFDYGNARVGFAQPSDNVTISIPGSGFANTVGILSILSFLSVYYLL